MVHKILEGLHTILDRVGTILEGVCRTLGVTVTVVSRALDRMCRIFEGLHSLHFDFHSTNTAFAGGLGLHQHLAKLVILSCLMRMGKQAGKAVRHYRQGGGQAQ